MVFKINNVDITPYIAINGLQWQRQDIDGPNAGRTLDGTMWRDRVTTKFKFNVTCKPLPADEAATILSLVAPEYITVTFTDPMTNQVVTKEAYSNNIPAEYLMKINGKEYWGGITFPVIER